MDFPTNADGRFNELRITIGNKVAFAGLPPLTEEDLKSPHFLAQFIEPAIMIMLLELEKLNH